MKHINTFNEGLDFDTSKNKRSNATYYDALDLRIISDEALSNGALVNFKGTKSKIDLFDRDHKLIGYCQIRNTLVLFIFQDILPTGISLIYKVDLDGTDDIQIPVLVYSDELSATKLNFPSDGRISAKSRYEASSIQKVYWVDGVNQLRSININDYSVINGITINNNLGREASSFDSIPPNDMSGSISTEIINGSGSYNSGVVFYAYQFYKKNGAASTIYKSQYPVKLSLYSGVSDGGGNIGEESNCSVIVNISGISTQAINLYDRIRVYAVFYEEQLAPSINIVAERAISSSLSVVDNGNPIGTMSNEEFSFYKESSYVPNVIESKDNILFIGNINENTFTSEVLDTWDARAYRFSGASGYIHSASESEFIEVSDTTFKVVSTNVPGLIEGEDVPDDFDCLNLYNNTFADSFFNRTTTAEKINRFNSAGLYGGEGKNIKYSFVEDTRIIDSNAVGGMQSGSAFVESNQSDSHTLYGDLIECEAGEVYRVGIQFFNAKGQKSFVKWIGDILWEEPLESTGPSPKVEWIAPSDDIRNTVKLLKVELKNNPSLLDPNIVGWQVVRAKRESSDRTSVANGLLQQASFYTGSIQGEAGSKFRPRTKNEINNYLDTIPLFRFISPDTMFNDTGDKKLDGYKFRIYNKLESREYAQERRGGLGEAYSKKYKGLRPLIATFYTDNLIGVKEYRHVTPQHKKDGVLDQVIKIDSQDYLNQQRPGVFLQDYEPNAANSDFNNYAGSCSTYIVSLEDVITVNASDSSQDGNGFYASLIRNVDKTRYGGVSYQDILSTQYIPFSDIHNTSMAESICKYGDSYTNMFYYMDMMWQDTPGDSDGAYEIAAFPVQSTIDLRKRQDRLLDYVLGLDDVASTSDFAEVMQVQETVEEGVKFQGTLYDTSIGDLYVYNNAYSSENSVSTSISKPFDFVEYGFNDVKVLASDKKVNTEDIDSWTNFGTNEFIEVASEYGSLNELMFHKNSMYFFQDNAVGLLAINDRSLISGDSNIKLALGTGGVLERFDYINTNIGVMSKHHLVKTKEDIFIVDVLNKGIFLVSNLSKSLSLEAGVSSFVKSKINELGKDSAVAIGYDKEFNEIIFTINGESIVYSDSTKKFTSKYSTAPKFFISLNDRLMSYVDDEISTGTARYVYQHNLGQYGEYYSEAYKDNGLNLSTLKLSILVNPNNILINRFDVIDFRTDIIEGSDKIAIDRLTFENSYIAPIVKNIVTSGQYKNTSFLITGFRTQVPLTTNGNRFVDSYMIVSFEFDNRNNIPFRLHDVMTFYENSKR